MDRSPEQIYALAKAQKMILWCVLANIALNALSASLQVVVDGPAFDGPFRFVFVFTLIASFLILAMGLLFAAPYYTYRIAKELGSPVPWLWAPFVLIPLINLLVLIVLSSRATKILREHGHKVGLMGADLKALRVAPIEEKSQ